MSGHATTLQNSALSRSTIDYMSTPASDNGEKNNQMNKHDLTMDESIPDYLELQTIQDKININKDVFILKPEKYFQGLNKNSQELNNQNIIHVDKDQYIKCQERNNKLVYSCRLIYTNMNKKFKMFIHNSDSLYIMTCEEGDVFASVGIDDIEIDFKKPFENVREQFLKKVKIVHTFKDNFIESKNNAYADFEKLLRDRLNNVLDSIGCAEDMFQFIKILKNFNERSEVIEILKYIFINGYISKGIKDKIVKLIKALSALIIRMRYTPKYFNTQEINVDLYNKLHNICDFGIELHKNKLLNMCVSELELMEPFISDLDDTTVICINNDDMKLFSDIASIRGISFTDFWNNSEKDIIEKISTFSRYDSLQISCRLTNNAYYSLYKLYLDGKPNEQSTWGRKWEKIPFIRKVVENKCTWCNVITLNETVKTLIDHFRPGVYTHTDKIKYTLTCFNGVKEKNEIEKMPEDRKVWIYILDNSICEEKLSKTRHEIYKPLFDMCIQYVNTSDGRSHESFRIIIQNVKTFVKVTNSFTDTNIDILKNQIDNFKKVQVYNQLDQEGFKSLMEEYVEFWKSWFDIMELSKRTSFKEKIKVMRDCLQRIANLHCEYKSDIQLIVNFTRAYNEFIGNLKKINFDWYIKDPKEGEYHIQHKNIEIVDNKLKDNESRSYKVVDVEEFLRYENEKSRSVAVNFIIEVVIKLLNLIESLNLKKWPNVKNGDTYTIRINSLIDMFASIGSSFLYLREQPDYVSFEEFLRDSTLPFEDVINNSSSNEDYKKRVNILKESFWYLRKQDEIDINQALKLYNELNHQSIDKIHDYYKIYSDKFDYYIKITVSKAYDERISFILSEMDLKSVSTDAWSRKIAIPSILAGLSAVWSIQKSKNLVSIQKSLKPHCIKILCILRLLNMDGASAGLENHLAQVLTGQGKSLLLALLSSVLTLLGNKVRIVCYSEYLVKRDEQEFSSFYEIFGIKDKITYGTFDNMANEVLACKSASKTFYLRDLVENRIVNKSQKENETISLTDFSKTILLIDEVDVFFTDRFFGKVYNVGIKPNIPSLEIIQEFIWKLVNEKINKNVNYKEKIELMLQEKSQNKVREKINALLTYLNNENKYILIKKKEGNCIVTEYSNLSLYEEHLESMIQCAIKVANGNNDDWYIKRYKIDSNGFITYYVDGIYKRYTWRSYYNTFNYFRLKKTEFDHKNYQNYGYLDIDCGSVSYAELPKNYAHILGVTGTLTQLHQHETRTVSDFYNIKRTSIMPSYFGQSNLIFDKKDNFISKNTQKDWLDAIFQSAMTKVEFKRSVLIIFDTDLEIRKFEDECGNKFDRLHVLSDDSASSMRERYVAETGVARTVTLASRVMGRGVDYQSSVAVEAQGGMHVIQTFFSEDPKEETQIKGRTARKDNRGSYELVVCKQHLLKSNFISEETTEIDYNTLDAKRREIMSVKGEKNESRIKEANKNHELTMNYFKSFFK